MYTLLTLDTDGAASDSFGLEAELMVGVGTHEVDRGQCEFLLTLGALLLIKVHCCALHLHNLILVCLDIRHVLG